MRPTEVLRHEHEQILEALSVLGALAGRSERGEGAPRDAVDRLVEFFRNVADRCHHAKEENALFPALEARGIPRHGGPIGVMLREHDEGRALLRAVAEAAVGAEGDGAARSRFAAAARAYEDLLGEHIQRENEVLFHLADRVLDAADDARVAALFARYDALELGPGERERLLSAVTELARTYL